MTTMNVSLPEQMKKWIETKISDGQYHNASEYVRDLIRKDQSDLEKKQAFRTAIQAGRDSRDDERSFNQIINEARITAKNQD